MQRHQHRGLPLGAVKLTPFIRAVNARLSTWVSVKGYCHEIVEKKVAMNLTGRPLHY